MYTPMYSMYGENFKFRAYTTEFVAVQKKSTTNAQNHAKHGKIIISISKKLHKIFSRNITNLSDSISQTERIIKFFPAHANFLHENKKIIEYICYNMNILLLMLRCFISKIKKH